MPTPNFNLPTFSATDSVDLMGVYNAAMEAIDTAMKTIQDTATTASSTANAASTTANEAKTAAEGVASTASEALSTANTANENASQAIAATAAITKAEQDDAFDVAALAAAKMTTGGFVYYTES